MISEIAISIFKNATQYLLISARDVRAGVLLRKQNQLHDLKQTACQFVGTSIAVHCFKFDGGKSWQSDVGQPQADFITSQGFQILHPQNYVGSYYIGILKRTEQILFNRRGNIRLIVDTIQYDHDQKFVNRDLKLKNKLNHQQNRFLKQL
ncbi:unnamed protein product [Paramecium octaurelia]|uniref:Uncharacterized protein n=1 Tax=Paramecium octaurelia TaxID=43137 RepID=A0A8S1YRQ8_PAROT|nr:unnamed protein product [Paramecium octaurelia]